MSKEKIRLEIYTNANKAFEDIAEEILKDKDKKAIINILKKNFDLEDCLLEIKELQEENKIQDHELERLRNIIKEAREYIEKHFMSIDGAICIDFGDHTCAINDNFLDELLEIINKVNSLENK